MRIARRNPNLAIPLLIALMLFGTALVACGGESPDTSSAELGKSPVEPIGTRESVEGQGGSREGIRGSTGNEADAALPPTPTPTETSVTCETLSQIAFESDQNGDAEIYVMNADGSGLTNLTNSPGYDGYPRWSPDGRRIAFVSNRHGGADIFVMNADGSGLTNLTNTPSSPEYYPAWSPDGRQIAFVRKGLYVMNADGSGRSRLAYEHRNVGPPVWSPDGYSIWFHSNHGGGIWKFYEVNVIPDGHVSIINAGRGDSDHYDLSFSPDGRSALFISQSNKSADGGSFDIYVMSVDNLESNLLSGVGHSQSTSTTSKRLTGTSLVGAKRGPSWSPDGGRIMFYLDHAYEYSVYVMNADGSTPTRLADGISPKWSPDGCSIAFASLGEGKFRIYVMNTDGSGQKSLADGLSLNASNYDSLTWSPRPEVSSRAGSGSSMDPQSTDRAALIALYNATGGPDWLNSDGWLTDGPLGDWYGVTTDSDGQVIEIRLPDNGLSGELPEELGNLASLTWLDLDYNELRGTIPAELGSLGALTVLRLGSNELSGSIPPELGNLGSLSILGLGNNHLSGALPPQLAGLSGLTQVSLWNNRLTGPIPAGMGNITGLTKLNLGNNRLDGPIPSTLGNLANLEELNLSRNRLQGTIPQELGDLADLRMLYLNNQDPFRGGDTASLPNPELVFRNDYYYLHGEIPQELGDLENLTVLSLSQNRLSGAIPWQLGKLTGLTRLHLYDNKLEGPIPWQLANLRNLEGLNLGHNRLDGNIPGDLGVLENLADLRLNGNFLEGNIPTQLSSLRNLEVLDLSNNRLDGHVPDDLDFLDSLGLMDLSNNELSGNIPGPRIHAGTRSNRLPDLTTLNLSGNNLDGPIPVELNRLASLQTLDLSRNKLEGNIPEGLGRLENLQTLNLGDNNLNGRIPTWLGSHGNLALLNIQGNPELEQAFGQVSRNEDAISRDQHALTLLFYTTGGAHWKNNDNWNTAAPLSEWYGVTVAAEHDPNRPNRTGRVIGLALTDNGLSGDVSDWAASLVKDGEKEQGDALFWLESLSLSVDPVGEVTRGDDLSNAFWSTLPSLSELTATVHYSEVYRVSEEVVGGALPVIKTPIGGATWGVRIVKTTGAEGGRVIAWANSALQTPAGKVVARGNLVHTVVTSVLDTELIKCVAVEGILATGITQRGVGQEIDFGKCLREVDNFVGDAITAFVSPFIDIGGRVLSWVSPWW